ncbi:MAG: hypothetical protein R3F59_21770 [Myxococcota bacterium]
MPREPALLRASGADLLGPVPTARTRFLRGFLPWQLLRFLAINLRMLRMIRLSHPHVRPPAP